MVNRFNDFIFKYKGLSKIHYVNCLNKLSRGIINQQKDRINIDYIPLLMSKQQLINKIFFSVKNNVETPLKITGQQLLTYSLKDNICVKAEDDKTTCNSSMLWEYKSPFNSTIYDILSKESNLKFIGKTRLDEFAMGSMGINGPNFNPKDVLNPLFPDRVPGGSSSGSAASVSGGLVDFSLGTDTGGSVRLPASWCGTMGFKPSYGKISRYGVVDMAQSLDTVGVISNDIDKIYHVFKLLDQYDPKDTTSLPEELRFRPPQQDLKSEWKIGIPREICIDLCDPIIWNKFEETLHKLLSVPGVTLHPVSIPSLKLSLPIYYTLCPSEVASNLARYDGVRYGSREKNEFEDQDNDTDITLFASTRSKHFGKEVKRRIMLGNHTLSSGSYQNNYLKAQRLRMRLIDEFNSIFQVRNVLMGKTEIKTNSDEGIDFMLVPTSLTPPPKMDDVVKSQTNKQQEENPVTNYMNDFFTVPMSLAGLPTISIPMSLKSNLGVQIVGQYGDDYKVLNFAKNVMINSNVST
ncbi:Trimeric GatFAB AmidoTransferase(AdT) complex subunit [Monosporozyma unispora]|nr:Trimeric GatFAB AmidoTransferase(AdT) complex subunit [Kazachstania unispora]